MGARGWLALLALVVSSASGDGETCVDRSDRAKHCGLFADEDCVTVREQRSRKVDAPCACLAPDRTECQERQQGCLWHYLAGFTGYRNTEQKCRRRHSPCKSEAGRKCSVADEDCAALVPQEGRAVRVKCICRGPDNECQEGMDDCFWRLDDGRMDDGRGHITEQKCHKRWAPCESRMEAGKKCSIADEDCVAHISSEGEPVPCACRGPNNSECSKGQDDCLWHVLLKPIDRSTDQTCHKRWAPCESRKKAGEKCGYHVKNDCVVREEGKELPCSCRAPDLSECREGQGDCRWHYDASTCSRPTILLSGDPSRDTCSTSYKATDQSCSAVFRCFTDETSNAECQQLQDVSRENKACFVDSEQSRKLKVELTCVCLWSDETGGAGRWYYMDFSDGENNVPLDKKSRHRLVNTGQDCGQIQCFDDPRLRAGQNFSPCSKRSDAFCAFPMYSGTSMEYRDCVCMAEEGKFCRGFQEKCTWHGVFKLSKDGEDKNNVYKKYKKTNSECFFIDDKTQCYDYTTNTTRHHADEEQKRERQLCPANVQQNGSICHTGLFGQRLHCVCLTADKTKCERVQDQCVWHYTDNKGLKFHPTMPPQPCEVRDENNCYVYDQERDTFHKNCSGDFYHNCVAKDENRSACKCVEDDTGAACPTSPDAKCHWLITSTSKPTNQICKGKNPARFCYSAADQLCPTDSRTSTCRTNNFTGHPCTCSKIDKGGKVDGPCDEGDATCFWVFRDEDAQQLTKTDQPCEWKENKTLDTQCVATDNKPCSESARAVERCQTPTSPTPRPCSCRHSAESECEDDENYEEDKREKECYWFYASRGGTWTLAQSGGTGQQKCNMHLLPERQCSFRYDGRGWTCSDLDSHMPCATRLGLGDRCVCIAHGSDEGVWAYGSEHKATDPPQSCYDNPRWVDEKRLCYRSEPLPTDHLPALCNPTGDYNCEDLYGRPCTCRVPGAKACPPGGDCFFFTSAGLQTEQPCRASAAALRPFFPFAILPLLLQ